MHKSLFSVAIAQWREVMSVKEQINKLEDEWANSPRWKGVTRTYSAADVVKLRGTVQIEHTLARMGSEKFWRLINQEDPVCGLGALTGNQAIQEVQAGLKAIYCSGWQVAGDGNSAGEMYPDQSLYPVDSVPKMLSASITPLYALTKSTH